MKTQSTPKMVERRTEAGIFQWREGYTSNFEHFIESIKSAQGDYNKLMQHCMAAKTPIDLVSAWNQFAQCRISHGVQAFNSAIAGAADWKSSVPRVE